MSEKCEAPARAAPGLREVGNRRESLDAMNPPTVFTLPPPTSKGKGFFDGRAVHEH